LTTFHAFFTILNPTNNAISKEVIWTILSCHLLP